METSKTRFDLNDLPELLSPDKRRQELARKRQCAVWHGEEPDRWPIVARAPLTEAQDHIPGANFKEAFYDWELMLCSQVRAACSMANSGSDGIPSIRANMGTGVLLSCLGLEQEVFEDKMPWLQQRLSKEEAARLEPDDIEIRGSFERGMQYMRNFREVMGDSLPVFCMDTQGPFALAHLILGEQLLYELIDDAPFVHHLLNLCVELGDRAHRWMKNENGEPLEGSHHSNKLYSDNIGIRICEDSAVMVGPDIMDEFVVPYSAELARRFGSAWAHYCGRNDNLTRKLAACPEIKGLNFGHVPGKVYDHPFEQDMQECLGTGTVLFGSWPRYEGENPRAYLERLHGWASRGCLIPEAGPALAGEDGFERVEDMLDFWYSL